MVSDFSSFTDISWFVDSKLTPYRPSFDLVRRTRLLDSLMNGQDRKLVLVTAPAGYGKSSLLAQWVAEADKEGSRYCWLTLESEEADPKRFLAYVTFALSENGIELDDLVTGARNGYSDSATDAVLSKLTRQLNNTAQKIVLILEDYHHAESEAVNAIIYKLLKDSHENFTVFIDTRTPPKINIFSLIAAGDAIEIDATQLRLTKDETLDALGEVATAEFALELFEKTEGWPVAVQLAKLQQRNSPQEPVVSGAKGGLIASYLTEQVLSSLDHEVQEFLLSCAFLSRFNAELVNAVMEEENGWRHIDQLSSFSALIVPLDVERNWYRLHHLFAEYLKELQIRRDLTKANRILSTASRWYAERGDTVRAVKYAASAHDYDLCRDIILQGGGWRIILTDGIGDLRSALRYLPVAEINKSASLLIATAYLHCKDGEFQQARAQLDAAIALLKIDYDEEIMVERLVVESMINLYEDVGEWGDDYQATRESFLAGGKFDPLEVGTLRCEELLISLSHGEFDKSSAALREAFANMRQSSSVLGLNYCYIHAAHIAIHRADFDMATANIERAFSMAEENFGSDSGLKNLSLVLLYSLHAWQGEVSQERLKDFEGALEHIFENDGWTEIYITALEGFLSYSIQCNDLNNAIRVLKKTWLTAGEKNLVRLQRFIEAVLSPLEGAGDFAVNGGSEMLKIHDSPREWQANVERYIASLPGESVAQSSSIIQYLDEIKANLKRIKIDIAILANSNADVDENYLLRTVQRASKINLMGPFLSSKTLLGLMRKSRQSLRHNEQELMTLRFVENVLETAKSQSPSLASSLLSERESEILHKLSMGQTNKEIARELELTENTIKFHLKSLYSKLSVNKRTKAVIEARKQGLLD